ncbi:serine hydrolase domain-containing protein [uncultured Algibacter sp.]|uniref:serine hydrolase domain-containing protein n=1 Tax=uncultured Algibacter sp. TaxID=298659 RepID=UPI00261D48AA|nr:serine hydrolase domain-containing protein [uncultured Algibacter sp.]
MKSQIIAFILVCFFFSCKTPRENFKPKPVSASDYALAFLKKNDIPGMSIAVSKNGTLIWSQSFGFSDLKTYSKVTKNTKFRIASISKPITAIALGTLVDKGKVHLDSSLYKYLPDFPKKKYNFTIRQIGGHTAGIRHYKGNEFNLNKKLSITEGLNIFKEDSLLYKPLSNYKYSTYGYNLLSEVIQTVADTSFSTYVKTIIFNPLNMNASTIDNSDSILPNRTQFYIKNKANKVVLGPEVNIEFKVAGGGFLSTSEDLIWFGNEIIFPKIVSKETLQELLKPQVLKSGEIVNYGVGFSLDKTKKETPRYSHSGSGIGASTLLLIYPEERIVISILTNLSQVPIFDLGNQLEAIFVN